MEESIAVKDAIDLLLKAIGVVVGAAWVVRNYWLSRTHVPRLQLHVKAEPFRSDGRDCLLVTIAVGNPGQSKVELRRVGTTLSVYSPVFLAESGPDREPDWGDPETDRETMEVLDAVFAAKNASGYIEPGVTVNEQLLIGLGDAKPSIRRLVLRVELAEHGVSYTAVAINLPQPKASGGRQPVRKEPRK